MNEQDSDQDQANSSKARSILLVSLLVMLIVVPVLFLIMLGLGTVQGVEFSPDDFSRREFSYNQMPLTGWIVSKKQYVDLTSDLERSLVVNKLVPAVVLKKKRWHLVSEIGPPVISHECDARFLTGYLDKLHDEGGNYWDTWNTDFPKSAKVFWPHVAELARDEMYFKVADVMRVAMSISKDNPDSLDRSLHKTMSQAYLELGTLDSELGRLERAKYRLERSIEFDSNSKAAEKLESLKMQTPVATPVIEADE